VRPCAFGRLDYDRVLAELRARLHTDAPTFGALVVAMNRHTSAVPLQHADFWFAEPARHYLRAAMSGFADYSRRFQMAYCTGCVPVLSADAERKVYQELASEPNRVLAINRIVAFEPLAPTVTAQNGNSFTSAQHDSVVNFVMLLAHMVDLAEWAAAQCALPPTPPPRIAPIGAPLVSRLPRAAPRSPTPPQRPPAIDSLGRFEMLVAEAMLRRCSDSPPSEWKSPTGQC
jgi:hypothetical protein